jgi:hypothetical protein
VKLPPYNDPIALKLRDHFATEASDAGLRSPSLEGSPKASSSPDAAAVARASSGRQAMHSAVRDALRRIGPDHADVLSLAYGVTFRYRDIDDGNRRKALRKEERNWRVLLRETYRLGEHVAIVLASKSAREAQGDAVAWLLSEAAKNNHTKIEDECVELLVKARKLFAAAYIPPKGSQEDPLQVEHGKRKRARPIAGDTIRVRAFGGVHNREVGG